MNRKSDTALLIINYGTPDTASRGDVAHYLRQLLDNKHVMTMNAAGRKILVNCIIAPSRSKKSSKLYQRLSDISGGEMPLKKHTKNFADKVQLLLGGKADVYVAMTAGYSLVADVMDEVLRANYYKIVVAPMFPQYTESTWGKILDDVYGSLQGRFNVPPVSVIQPFFDDEMYLDALCGHISNHLPDVGSVEKVIFSYHGVPIMHTEMTHPGHTCSDLDCANNISVDNRRCYLAQCHAQTRMMASRLGIPPEKYITAFQSRFADKWVGPTTDSVVSQFAKDGIKRIAVVTPSFTVDCLETIVEIDDNLRKNFMQNTGNEMIVVPCLNDLDSWVNNFCKIVTKSL